MRAATGGSGRRQLCRRAGPRLPHNLRGKDPAACAKYEAEVAETRVGAPTMKQLLSVVAVTLALISPAWAQGPSAPAAPEWPPWPQQAYVPGAYPPAPLLNAPTPGDAYRQGLINRWELERLEGPTPQALQGPSPNGGNAAPGSGGN
jgi:hypothetical protein